MTVRNSSFAPSSAKAFGLSAATMEATLPAQSAVRVRLDRMMRAIECKSKMILIAVSIGLLGLTATVSAAEPSLQQQLEMLQRQLEQQQRMIQEMQRQLDEQKTADEQRQREQRATEAEHIAQEREREGEKKAPMIGIDLSRETDRFGDSKSTQLKVPDTDTVLTLSGFIRGSAIHDFDKIASPTKFLPSDIVVNGQPTGQPSNRTTFTANVSQVDLNLRQPRKL